MENEKGISIGGDNFGTNIIGDNNSVHLPRHIIPKVLTEKTGLANDINFVGRKEELQKVDELLNQNSMLLLLNGIGGIGKSTLASYYLNKHKENFDYYGFVQVNEDIKLSLASALATSLDLKSEKIDDLFAEIMNRLQNLEGKKLLIIDDVKEMDNQHDEINTLMTLNNSGFQILFTSREVKENIPQYFLDIMSIEDARELFLKHHTTDEMEKVDKILAYLDYHTLFIEMTAKTLTQRKEINKNTKLNIHTIVDKFEKGEFSTIEKNKSESFNQFLNNLFANDKILQDEEILLFIKRLSILPPIEISFENLNFYTPDIQDVDSITNIMNLDDINFINQNNYNHVSFRLKALASSLSVSNLISSKKIKKAQATIKEEWDKLCFLEIDLEHELDRALEAEKNN